jgi:hypothetical protein
MSIAALLDRAEAYALDRRISSGVSRAEVAAATGKRHGELGNLRGRSNERRAVEALESSPLPNWIVSWRPATPSEDAAGADLVFILTGDVRVWVNVKSSAAHAKRYRQALKARATTTPIGTVVVDAHMTRSEIVERILVTLAAVSGCSR